MYQATNNPIMENRTGFLKKFGDWFQRKGMLPIFPNIHQENILSPIQSFFQFQRLYLCYPEIHAFYWKPTKGQ